MQDYTSHLNQAIAAINEQIDALVDQGIREGSIAQSPTCKQTVQYHWCHNGKRVYVSRKNEPQYRAEIERGREVNKLRSKRDAIEALI